MKVWAELQRSGQALAINSPWTAGTALALKMVACVRDEWLSRLQTVKVHAAHQLGL